MNRIVRRPPPSLAPVIIPPSPTRDIEDQLRSLKNAFYNISNACERNDHTAINEYRDRALDLLSYMMDIAPRGNLLYLLNDIRQLTREIDVNDCDESQRLADLAVSMITQNRPLYTSNPSPIISLYNIRKPKRSMKKSVRKPKRSMKKSVRKVKRSMKKSVRKPKRSMKKSVRKTRR